MPPKKGKAKATTSKKKAKAVAEKGEEDAHVEESTPMVETTPTAADVEVQPPPRQPTPQEELPAEKIPEPAGGMDVDSPGEPSAVEQKAAGPSMSMDERQAKLEQLRSKMVSYGRKRPGLQLC